MICFKKDNQLFCQSGDIDKLLHPEVELAKNMDYIREHFKSCDDTAFLEQDPSFHQKFRALEATLVHFTGDLALKHRLTLASIYYCLENYQEAYKQYKEVSKHGKKLFNDEDLLKYKDAHAKSKHKQPLTNHYLRAIKRAEKRRDQKQVTSSNDTVITTFTIPTV